MQSESGSQLVESPANEKGRKQRVKSRKLSAGVKSKRVPETLDGNYAKESSSAEEQDSEEFSDKENTPKAKRRKSQGRSKKGVESGDFLLDSLQSADSSVNAIIADLLEMFQANEKDATGEVVNFLLKVYFC
jgi:hypothetical protein